MSRQGKGYWLNPKTDKYVQVDRHELSAQREEDMKKVGITKFKFHILDKIKRKDVDGIRLKAIEMGLVRLRDNPSSMHVQFNLPRNKVKEALWSVLNLMKKEKLTGTWAIVLENMNPSAKDVAELSFSDFKKALKNDTTIMKEWKEEKYDQLWE